MSENIIRSLELEEVPFEEIRSVQGEMIITESYPSYLVDESKISGGRAEWLFFPTNEREIATIIRKMKEEKHQITISAARTGIVGSAVPFGGSVISLEKMDKVIGIGLDNDEKRWFVRVQPAISLNDINDFVKGKKFILSQSIPEEKNYVQQFCEDCTYYYPVDHNFFLLVCSDLE